MRWPEIHSADWARLSEPPEFVSVSKAEMLRLLVKQRVNAVVEEAFEALDGLTADYEETVSRLREHQLHRSGLCIFIIVPGLHARFTGLSHI